MMLQMEGTALEFCFAACLDYDRPELSAREFTAYNLVDLCMHRLDSEQDKVSLSQCLGVKSQ